MSDRDGTCTVISYSDRSDVGSWNCSDTVYRYIGWSRCCWRRLIIDGDGLRDINGIAASIDDVVSSGDDHRAGASRNIADMSDRDGTCTVISYSDRSDVGSWNCSDTVYRYIGWSRCCWRRLIIDGDGLRDINGIAASIDDVVSSGDDHRAGASRNIADMSDRDGTCTVISYSDRSDVGSWNCSDTVYRYIGWSRCCWRRLIIDGDGLRDINGIAASIDDVVSSGDDHRAGASRNIADMSDRDGTCTVISYSDRSDVGSWNCSDTVYRYIGWSRCCWRRLIIDGDDLRDINGIAASIDDVVSSGDDHRAGASRNIADMSDRDGTCTVISYSDRSDVGSWNCSDTVYRYIGWSRCCWRRLIIDGDGLRDINGIAASIDDVVKFW